MKAVNGGDGFRIVVVGASAGGVEALKSFVAGLSNGLSMAVFVVLHTSPFHESHLPAILSREGEFPAYHPEDGDRILPGRIYVARPDYHLMVERGHVRVLRGPKENRFRPAVDPLFRSAAEAYGSRVIGVVLSGGLDDGASGLRDIKQAGGIAIVQDPNDAVCPGMPRSALDGVEADHILPAPAIGPMLKKLVAEPKERAVMPRKEREEAVTTSYSCPDCGGVLWQVGEEEWPRFRCQIGHMYSLKSLIGGDHDCIENALDALLRMIHQTIDIYNKLAEAANRKQDVAAAQEMLERVREHEEDRKVIHNMLERRKLCLFPSDAAV